MISFTKKTRSDVKLFTVTTNAAESATVCEATHRMFSIYMTNAAEWSRRETVIAK